MISIFNTKWKKEYGNPEPPTPLNELTPQGRCKLLGHKIEFGVYEWGNQATGGYKCTRCGFFKWQYELSENEDKTYWNKSVNTDKGKNR